MEAPRLAAKGRGGIRLGALENEREASWRHQGKESGGKRGDVKCEVAIGEA
jgi:hypothetical protein